jgi:protein-tyrosine phosphatase
VAKTGYVDIHAHVLPGIDDGPRDLEGALALLRAAADSGTTTIAATPHLRSDFPDVHIEELAGRLQAVRDAAACEQIPIQVVCGAEASLLWALEAPDEDLRLATYHERGTHLLVETPAGSGSELDHLLYQLRLRGLRIILAHPERRYEFQRDISQIQDLVDQGVLLQINADSLLGGGRRSAARRLAEQLCTEGLVHALASDGHRSRSWRPVTRLALGVKAAATLVGEERARWMSADAPRAILAGTELPAAPPVVGGRSRWAFRPRSG